MRTRLAGLPYGQLSYDASGAREFLVNANWALYVDNYLEGFHIPYVHQSLAGTLDYGAYAVELDRYSVLQLGIAKDGETAFRLPAAPSRRRACCRRLSLLALPHHDVQRLPMGGSGSTW